MWGRLLTQQPARHDIVNVNVIKDHPISRFGVGGGGQAKRERRKLLSKSRPGSPTVSGLYAALWTTGALLLRTVDEALAEKCLRSALSHTPDDHDAKAQLATQWAAMGKEQKAIKLASGIPKRLVKACTDDARYREVGRNLAGKRLVKFRALCTKAAGRTRQIDGL